MVWTSTEMLICKLSIVKVIAAYSTGNGWQSGITSLVFLIANNPAALENSNTSPLGTVLFLMASMVSFRETDTTAVAMAFRSVFCLWVMLTIGVLFPRVRFVRK